MAIQEIGKFKLQQRSAYVSRMQVKYLDGDGNVVYSAQTSDEVTGQDYFMDPADLGVPDGSMVWLFLWVMAGYDQTAPKAFIYKHGSNITASYSCTGVTVAPHLNLDGIS
jgi:hypothetical protein